MSATFDAAADLYQSVILERGRSPHHMHRMEPFDAAAKGDNPMCGDRVEVRLRLDGDRIAEAAFEARGCAISIASADLMVDAVSGHKLSEVRDLSVRFHEMVQSGSCPGCDDAMDRLRPLSSVSEYKSRIKCATLPWDALLAALENSDHG